MNAKNYFIALLFICFFSVVASAQEKTVAADTQIDTPKDEDEELISHKVTQGETVMLIAKKYKVKPTDIYEYNLDAINGVAPNVVLQIPVHRDFKHKKAKAATANTLADSGNLKEN